MDIARNDSMCMSIQHNSLCGDAQYCHATVGDDDSRTALPLAEQMVWHCSQYACLQLNITLNAETQCKRLVCHET